MSDVEDGAPRPAASLGSASDCLLADVDDDGRAPRRTGTLWTASAHIVTAVIGSGVLSLPWSMAKLGWITGTITMAIFAVITYVTSNFLADSYRTPPADGNGPGKRNYTYKEAVQSNLGDRQTKLCAFAQYADMVGSNIGYTITASLCMAAIGRSNCLHVRGENGSCNISTTPYILLFGALQLLLSQIPDFSQLSVISIIAAIMSASYSTLGVILSLIQFFADGGEIRGTAGGSLFSNIGVGFQAENLWPALQAIGNIAFAYTYSLILIEIQDTIKSPPSEIKVMKKANVIGVSTTTFFYFLCACVGYAAFGQHAPGNILAGFGYSGAYWLVDIANICVIIHLIGAYQVFSQPLFAFFEDWAGKAYPNLKFIDQGYEIKLSAIKCHLSLFKLICRSIFVVAVTAIAMLLPFFNEMLGIIGALTFWPLTIYFPIQMHITLSKTTKWSTKWCLLEGLSFVSLLVSLGALVGSIQGVLVDLKVL